MITLDKVKIIREGRKKKVNNPGQGDLFDKGRPAQRQNPSTRKSVDQVKRDIEFQQDLKKAGASGDVSDTAGPEIRKKVEAKRQARVQSLKLPDTSFDSKTKAQTKFDDIFKGNKMEPPKSGGKTQFDISKTPVGKFESPSPKVSPEVEKKTFDKLAKETSTASKNVNKFGGDMKDLKRDVKRNKNVSNKVEKDIQKVIDKVEKKNKPPSSVGKNPYAQGDPLTGFKKGQQIGSSGINQADVSKKAKEFTNKVNKIRKSKSTILGTDGKPLTKIKGKVGFDPNPDYLRRLQAGGSADIGLDSNPQGGGAGGSTAGGTGSSTKGSSILGPDGKPLSKNVDSTVSKRTPKNLRSYRQADVERMLKKAKSQYRKTVDSGKEAIRQTKQQAYDAGKKFKDAAELSKNQAVFDASKKAYSKATRDTIEFARRAERATGGSRTSGTSSSQSYTSPNQSYTPGSGFGNNKFGGRRTNQSYYYNPKYNARTGKDAMNLLRRVRAKSTPLGKLTTAYKKLKPRGKIGVALAGAAAVGTLGKIAYDTFKKKSLNPYSTKDFKRNEIKTAGGLSLTDIKNPTKLDKELMNSTSRKFSKAAIDQMGKGGRYDTPSGNYLANYIKTNKDYRKQVEKTVKDREYKKQYDPTTGKFKNFSGDPYGILNKKS